VPPGGQLALGDPHGATLAVAVSDVRLTTDNGAMVGPPGTLRWLHTAVNAGPAPARVVLVEFKPSS
jgi:tRNA A37 threonylcarbamoyltransferase TsaD